MVRGIVSRVYSIIVIAVVNRTFCTITRILPVLSGSGLDEGTVMMYTCVSSFTADQLQDSETGDFIVATYEDSSRIAVLVSTT